jgi:hypothetical protein
MRVILSLRIVKSCRSRRRRDVVDLAEIGAPHAEDDLLVAADQLEQVDLLVGVISGHEGRDDLLRAVAGETHRNSMLCRFMVFSLSR